MTTERLLLRPWRDADKVPFAALNADAQVMEFLPQPLDRAQSDALVERICEHFERHRFGLWAVEAPGIAPLVGFVGLNIPTFSAHFTPCVEIGWRLAREYWGHGFATEAARGAMEFGFRQLALDEIVSFTVPANRRSRRVMERLGMSHNPAEDFDHPRLAPGHSLCRHVLYRLPRTVWRRETRGVDGGRGA
ncbi:MAG: GNAT family N-acetyltransferase [Planctomycetaceae bacterium]